MPWQQSLLMFEVALPHSSACDKVQEALGTALALHSPGPAQPWHCQVLRKQECFPQAAVAIATSVTIVLLANFLGVVIVCP